MLFNNRFVLIFHFLNSAVFFHCTLLCACAHFNRLNGNGIPSIFILAIEIWICVKEGRCTWGHWNFLVILILSLSACSLGKLTFWLNKKFITHRAPSSCSSCSMVFQTQLGLSLPIQVSIKIDLLTEKSCLVSSMHRNGNFFPSPNFYCFLKFLTPFPNFISNRKRS